MSQRYYRQYEHDRMHEGLCPECGEPAESHINDFRFWIPRHCDLLPAGVTERIEQYRSDNAEATA